MAVPVVIKGGKNYITLVLNPEIPFEELLQKVVEKFLEAEKFFQNEPIAIMFSGRELSQTEEFIIVNALTEYTKVHITNILDNNQFMHLAAELLQQSEMPNQQTLPEQSQESIYMNRDIEAGERIDVEQTVIVYGNVEKGAMIRTSGNIIVLGSLFGQAIAVDENSYILALDFEPENFKIGSSLGATLKNQKSKTSFKNRKAKMAKKAYIENGAIHIEQLYK